MRKLILAIVTAMMSVIAIATSLTDGLVGYWPFDGNANDYSGNGNHGSRHGVSSAADRNGNANGAYHFNGSSYISIPSSSSLGNIVNAVTISAWVKATEGYMGGGVTQGSGYISIVCKGDSTRQYGIQIDKSNNWLFASPLSPAPSTSIIRCASSAGYNLSRWQHVTLTWDGGHIRTYVNGALVGTKSYAQKLVKNSDSLCVGKDVGGTGGEGETWSQIEYLKGYLDDLRIYNRALSSSEVLDLYNGTTELFKVHFDANGGTGDEMGGQVFEVGKTQKLSKNTYRKDGYVFQGWAKTVVRANAKTVDYKDEAEIPVNADMTLYAVWDNPALTLTAESANWSSGSITLRCEDSDTSGVAHGYTLEYKNASGVWEEVDGAKNKLATKGQDANGQEVWVAKLTDPTFWSRLGGIPPVEYRVKDDNGRVSEECVTRNRHCIAIGLSKWGFKNLDNTGGASSAKKFADLAKRKGAFGEGAIHLLTDSTAKTNGVKDVFSEVAKVVVPGDVCIFFINTHGGVNKTTDGHAVLAMYDGAYNDEDLAESINSLGYDVAVIGIISACHSGALFENPYMSSESAGWYIANSLAQCAANVAWLVSADADTNGFGVFSKFLLDYGWDDGMAGKSGEIMTFLDLSRYAKKIYDGLFSGIVFCGESKSKSVQIWNDPLLARILAGGSGLDDGTCSEPSAPVQISASQGESSGEIRVSWQTSQDAKYYAVFCSVSGMSRSIAMASGEWANASFTVEGIKKVVHDRDVINMFINTSHDDPALFTVRAINKAGASDLSEPGIGWLDSTWWEKVTKWLKMYKGIYDVAGGDIPNAVAMPAANGCRTVGECYNLGIDPEDPDDDLRIAEFKMKDGKPEITLNHTKDGSGNSFEDRVKILGKAELSEAEWQEVPPEGNPAHRFFKVGVEMP